jgi:hypothetical protein
MKEESNEARDSMKVEEGGKKQSTCKGHCTKQWVKIPKAT